MGKPLKDYLPPILLNCLEFNHLCNAEQPEIDDFLDGVNNVLDSQFVMTAPEMAVKRYERIFSIIPKDTETLEERRFAVLTKMNTKLPYTWTALLILLNTLCGEDGFTAERNVITQQLKVLVALSSRNMLQAVVDLLEAVVPANMEIYCSLLYNQHLTLGKYTHEELAEYTHMELREKEGL